MQIVSGRPRPDSGTQCDLPAVPVTGLTNWQWLALGCTTLAYSTTQNTAGLYNTEHYRTLPDSTIQNTTEHCLSPYSTIHNTTVVTALWNDWLGWKVATLEAFPFVTSTQWRQNMRQAGCDFPRAAPFNLCWFPVTLWWQPGHGTGCHGRALIKYNSPSTLIARSSCPCSCSCSCSCSCFTLAPAPHLILLYHLQGLQAESHNYKYVFIWKEKLWNH